MRRIPCLVLLLGACGSSAFDLAAGTPVEDTPSLEAIEPRFGVPIPNPAAISSTFGPRWKTSANRYDFHPGIDYFDALGTPVFAIGTGTVEGVYPTGSTTFPAGGNTIVVRHALPSPRTFHGRSIDRIYAVYLHLDSFTVADGDPVIAGQTIGTMGMTGDTGFVHLHFEIRVQTVCSLPYQVANPESTCALGFDPHVHPFLFVGGANDDRITVTELPTSNGTALRVTATRGDLDLDVIETKRGTIGFVERAGIDATSLATLDKFEYGHLRLDPQPFSSTSTNIVYDLHFADAIDFLEIRDIYGRGVRFGER